MAEVRSFGIGVYRSAQEIDVRGGKEYKAASKRQMTETTRTCPKRTRIGWSREWLRGPYPESGRDANMKLSGWALTLHTNPSIEIARGIEINA